MTVVAGVDVGNSTTEVVLGRRTGTGIDVLGSGRAPTRRAKGSSESIDGAVALVHRLARQAGCRVDAAVAAPLRPVHTATAVLPEPEAETGRLRVVRAGAATAGGTGSGVGRPVLLADDRAGLATGADTVVVVVPAGTGYRRAVDGLREWAATGRLAAAVLADDEAVLVANRLPGVPVVDEVPADAVRDATLLAVEVAPEVGALRSLADPLRLLAALGLDEAERPHAARVAALLADSSNGVVALDDAPAGSSSQPAGWVDVGGDGSGRRVPYAVAAPLLLDGPVGLARAYLLPAQAAHDVDDLLVVDLAAVADSVLARRGDPGARATAVAALHTAAPYVDPAPALGERLGVEVRTVAGEPGAARRGALTTPGAEPSAVVVDLGGGTVDVVAEAAAVVAAGAGELLTRSVAGLTGATPAAAEWVKRGPASRVEAPQLLLDEDGSRQFLDRPAPPDAVGALVVRGPAGLLPFDRRHAPGEWRALRLRLKAQVLGGNVARALRSLDATPRTVVVVGGPAADEEVVASVTRALPDGVAVGRGDVGGTLGHRYAVAYGLLLSAWD